MVLVERMQIEPEPEFLELGTIHLIFEGDIDDPRSGNQVDQYIALLQDAVAVRQLEYSFYLDDRVVVISNLTFELDEIVEGSVVAKTKIIGGFVLATYGAIAAYPSFKEAVPMIVKDLSSTVEYIVENAPNEEEDLPPPLRVELFLKDEDEIEGQIDELRF